jgi:hypothetical protein
MLASHPGLGLPRYTFPVDLPVQIFKELLPSFSLAI